MMTRTSVLALWQRVWAVNLQHLLLSSNGNGFSAAVMMDSEVLQLQQQKFAA